MRLLLFDFRACFFFRNYKLDPKFITTCLVASAEFTHSLAQIRYMIDKSDERPPLEQSPMYLGKRVTGKIIELPKIVRKETKR